MSASEELKKIKAAAAARSKAFRERQKAAGFKQVAVWVSEAELKDAKKRGLTPLSISYTDNVASNTTTYAAWVKSEKGDIWKAFDVEEGKGEKEGKTEG